MYNIYVVWETPYLALKRHIFGIESVFKCDIPNIYYDNDDTNTWLSVGK